MTKARLSLGRLGEQLAAEKLQASGYAMVARNYRCSAGEIDLIARQQDDWVFVEVRTRRGRAFGTPEESITLRKRAHLIAAAQNYLQENALDQVAWRIDFVAVELTPRGQLLRVTHLENAVHG